MDICKVNWGFLASLHGNTCYFPTDNGALEIWRCLAALFELGPELVTHDLPHNHHHTQRRTIVFFVSPHTAGQMVSLILKLRKKALFFWSTFECHEIELHHVSKCQVRNLKIVRFELLKLSGAQRY